MLYASTANDIKDTLGGHWNGDYLWEAQGREQDGAVIHAIASFGKSTVYGPTSEEAAATIKSYNQAFCMEYPINRGDNNAGIPGILYGRYPGDSYAGGNPWQLLSAGLAELFYLAAKEMQEQVSHKGNFMLSATNHKSWMELLNLKEGASALDLAAGAVSAGDSVMTRIYEHVKNDGGRIDEQIDKNTGVQTSARTLTWSHANILHALHIRNALYQSQQFL